MTRRKDGLWQEVLIINGKKKYFYGKTKADVLHKLQQYREKQERGELFSSIAEEWREQHYNNIVPSTARGYEASFKRAIQEFDGVPIKEISARDVDVFLRTLAIRKYGKKVVSTQKNVLNMIFNFAIMRGDISANPCAAVQLPTGLHSKRRELPSERDIEIVQRSEWLFPFFLLYTGCRRGEALAVTYEDIDRENGIIHINKAVGYKDNKPYIKPTKTEAGRRDVILLDKLAERLPRGKGLIFPNKNGELFRDSQIRRAWAAWQKENGTDVTAHQLRHGYATILFDAGLEPKDAQYLLGHTTISMTQDIYTHIRQTRQKGSAKKLNDYVNKV